MKRRLLLAALVLVATLLSGASSLKLYSDESITIDNPVYDDIFASGSVVNINAPVDSAIVAGGVINVNAPVSGDLILAGGQVVVRSNISGKLIAMGSTINISSNISRNAVIMAKDVSMLPATTIGRDALVGAKRFYNYGIINGNLKVMAEHFENNGTAGSLEFQRMESKQKDAGIFQAFSMIGFLLLGLIGIRLFPGLFRASEAKMLLDPVISTLVGFLAIIMALVLAVILALTIIGIPISIVLLLLLVLAIMLSGLVVSFTLGRKITNTIKLGRGDATSFIIGYLILNLLFILPYIGWLFKILSASLGVGVLLYVVKEIRSSSKTVTSAE